MAVFYGGENVSKRKTLWGRRRKCWRDKCLPRRPQRQPPTFTITQLLNPIITTIILITIHTKVGSKSYPCTLFQGNKERGAKCSRPFRAKSLRFPISWILIRKFFEKVRSVCSLWECWNNWICELETSFTSKTQKCIGLFGWIKAMKASILNIF